MFLSLIGYLHSDWHTQMIYITFAPVVFILGFYWILPVSAAWLFSRGEGMKAKRVVAQFGKKFPKETSLN